MISIENVYAEQDEKYQLYLEKREKELKVRKQEDIEKWNSIDYSSIHIPNFIGIKNVDFRKLQGVEVLSCYVEHPWSEYKMMDFSKIEEMTIKISDNGENIVFPISGIKRLDIFFGNNQYEQASPIERLLMKSNKSIDISNLENLEELRISNGAGYKIRLDRNLDTLRSVIQTYCYCADYTWLLKCKNVETYVNYNSLIDSIKQIPFLPNLKNLTLSYNQLECLKDLDEVCPNVQRVDVSKNCVATLEGLESMEKINFLNIQDNPVASRIDKNTLKIKNVIVDENENLISRIEQWYDHIFYDSYRCASEKKDKYNLFRYFESYVNWNFRWEFYKLNPSRYYRSCYDVKVKKAYLNYAIQNYDFIEIRDEYIEQIQQEEKGIQYYYPLDSGSVLYMQRGIYIVTAIRDQYTKDIEIENYDGKIIFCKKEQIKTYFKQEKIDITGIRVKIFDFYKVGETQNFELPIIIAIKSMLENCAISNNVIFYGELKKDNIPKSLNISETKKEMIKMNEIEHIISVSKTENYSDSEELEIENISDINQAFRKAITFDLKYPFEIFWE